MSQSSNGITHGLGKPRIVLMALFFILLLIPILATAFTQGPAEDRSERFRRMSRDAEAKGLAEPFKGITTDGNPVPGLFAIKSTGVSTGPVRKAADALLAALTPEQRQKTMLAVEDPEWRKWMNQHFYIRQGVSFKEMSEIQRETAFGLLRAALSAKGLKLTRDIMRLNHTLGELNNNNFEEYGEWLYYITVMGKPSATEPWGWQLDGHHAIINYFVLGDQVVMTPFFAGSEPVIAESGRFKGTAILQDEQNKGLALVNALDYRIHSPVILIEFDHQLPANLRHLAAEPRAPNRQHIHAVVRTPNGNDYGKDLLRQHHERHAHR